MRICLNCLSTEHKSCDWSSIKGNTTKLYSNLQEAVVKTRTKITEKYAHATIKNSSVLNDLQENIKKMQQHEKKMRSFLKKLTSRQEIAMDKLEKYSKISSHSSAKKLIKALSKTMTLIDDPIEAPMIPQLMIPECQDPADDTDSDEEQDGEELEDLTSYGMVRPNLPLPCYIVPTLIYGSFYYSIILI